MRKSLGNKRHQSGDGEEGRPDQIGLITRVYGDFKQNDTRVVPVNGGEKEIVVSKIFDNEDFGYRKITVERPLRLNFQASAERIARIEDETVFRNLAVTRKKKEADRLEEIAAGEARQQAIRDLLAALAVETREALYKDRNIFLKDLRRAAKKAGLKLSAVEQKAVLTALGERNETAEICRDRNGNPEPDTDLRDTETVPLKEDIEAYVEREVKPYVPDAWIEPAKTKMGYEIPLTRHFYRYEPPRPLEAIDADLKQLEKRIVAMLKEVTA